MPLDEEFATFNERDRRELANGIYAHYTGSDDRHKQILGRLDLLLGALSAGMRAAADVLDRGRR